jgi:thiol-disulfide isomerase/thioredoxin
MMSLPLIGLIRASALSMLACVLLLPQSALCQAVNADPAAALLKQGKDDLASQHYEDAANAFKKANQLRHDTCADCYLDLAVAQTRLGHPDDALKSCDKAISCASDDDLRTMSHTLKGNILVQMGNDPKKLKAAESEYRAALDLRANSAITHLNLGVTLLKESQTAEGIQELQTYLRIAPGDKDADLARKLIANPKHAGQEIAPGFKVQTLDGETISLEQLSGKIVVMDFWATWCPPCRSSVPELKALTKKYPQTKVVLISFSADSDQQAWRDFVAKKDMGWPQYWDSDGRVRNAFGVSAFPTYLVIDQDGFIHERIVGLDPQQSVVARLKDSLREMLPSD